MRIKTQKILRFIPIVNFVTMFCWIYNCYKYHAKISVFLKYLMLMFLSMFALIIPEIIIDTTCSIEWVILIMDLISKYGLMFFVAFFSVKGQEAIISDEEYKNSANKRI